MNAEEETNAHEQEAWLKAEEETKVKEEEEPDCPICCNGFDEATPRVYLRHETSKQERDEEKRRLKMSSEN